MTRGETDQVLVLDFGGQYSHLIARRVRDCGVYSEIVPGDAPIEQIRSRHPGGLILSGGPGNVYAPGAPAPDPGIYELGVPILGICYGHQLLAAHYGGRECVSRGSYGGYGRGRLLVEDTADLFHGVPEQMDVWVSHGDVVCRLPQSFARLARSDSAEVAAMGAPELGIYGVQFHPEVHHTSYGRKILQNWLYRVCGLVGGWSMESFVDDAVDRIRRQVDDGHAICGLSGGVDSSVAAALVHRAVGDRLTCVFVDHGLMRQGEPELVREMFAGQLDMKLVFVDARHRFISALRGITDPEEKRRVVGHEFISVFEEQARELGDFHFLVQGTIYPDVVESGTGVSSVIKSHHNVGGLPDRMELQLVEPLRELFKDEVRRVGAELGLSEELLWRHPFPGPGLAVRVLGEVTEEKLAIGRGADAIFEEEIRRADLYNELWQAFAVVTDLRSVGVMGDDRTYGRTVVLRAVTSEDVMTAEWARLPDELLDDVSRRIVNEVRGVNRVVYDVTSKPPGTIEWE